MHQRTGEHTSKFRAEPASEERVDGFVIGVRPVVSGPKVVLEAFVYLSADRGRYY